MSHSEIRVRLVEAGTGRVLSEANVPIGSLPETFNLGKTALSVSSQLWTVVQADPVTRDECAQTGHLTLTLTSKEPVVEAPAKEVLYSLPTICDAIPETVPPGENVRATFSLQEGDWRQVELVAVQHGRAIDAEMYDIETIVRDHSIKTSELSGRAYQQVFVRQRIKTPVMPHVPLSDISAMLPANSWPLGGVGFQSGEPSADPDALVADSFAFDLGLCLVYGQLVNGAASVIGLHQYGTSNYGDVAAIAVFLDRLMTTHLLVLVDWCWRRKIGGGAAAIQSYLQKKYAER